MDPQGICGPQVGASSLIYPPVLTSVYLRPVNQSCLKTYAIRATIWAWTDRQTKQRQRDTIEQEQPISKY